METIYLLVGSHLHSLNNVYSFFQGADPNMRIPEVNISLLFSSFRCRELSEKINTKLFL